MADLTLSEAVQRLWELDTNRCEPHKDYELNVQKGKKPNWKDDSAPDSLFTSIESSVWERPTYAHFLALLDNYSAETTIEEYVNDSERKEVQSFLTAILETDVMKFCKDYCHSQDPSHVPNDIEDFKRLMYKIWFEFYPRERGGRLDSSGFEHVFLGEIKNDEVSGFHNWIQMAMEEQAGRLDYRGFIKPRSQSSDESGSNDHLLTVQFRWNGYEKFVGTSFIGTSPEFEMALYTMCFLVGEEDNHVVLRTGTDIFELTVKCYHMAGDKIGTCFPEVTDHKNE